MSERSLAAVVATPAGRKWLADHGVHTDVEQFAAALRPAADGGAATLAGLPPDSPLVYVGQQIAADFGHATAAKFGAVHDLRTADVASVVAWHDMDRAGSDRYGLRVVIAMGGRPTGVWLAHRKLGDREPRFIPADYARLEELLRKARSATSGMPRATRAQVLARLDGFAEDLARQPPETVAQAGRTVATRLLREHLDVEVPGVYVSQLATAGLLRELLLQVLDALDDVARVYNEAVADLTREGLDPQVHALDERWLPLWYSCPDSGRRLRLVRERAGADLFGTAVCPCGAEHRFHLGNGSPCLDELEAAGRWSPDVLLPVLCDHLFSGYVAGRSSAIYGIVMRRVLRSALERTPTPAFLPAALAAPPTAPPEPDSLLHYYLTA